MAPKAIFKGQTFAISGRLSQPQKEYEEIIRKHGGEVSTSVTAAVTFLVSTQDDAKAGSKKFTTAHAKGVPIVQEGFVGACVTAKKLLEPEFFKLKVKKPAASKAAPKAPPAKRKKVEKGPVTTADGITVIAKSGLTDMAAVVVEEVSKGFVKATLTWDVELVLNDPAKGKDKFYNMQLLASKTGDEFYAVQHWGRTGLEGQAHVDGPFTDIGAAKKIFRKRYRQKTGYVFGQVGGSFEESKGKYRLLVKKEVKEDEGPGRWQYYMHNSVDGKKIGWYDYDAGAAKNMEKYWRQFTDNEGLSVRNLRSDYFRYEVNFEEMIQRNVTSGTRRVIRRVPPGQEPDTVAPTSIPSPMKPEEKDDSDDEEEEAEEEEEDDEEADEDEEAEAEAEEGAGGEEEAAKEDEAEAAEEAPEEEEAAEEAAASPAAPAPTGRAAKEAAKAAAKAAAVDPAEADTLVAEDAEATLPLAGAKKARK